MIKDLQVTLYEIFGYVFPGAIVCFAFAILWNIFIPDQPFDFSLNYSKLMLAALLALAYLAGHLMQGVGNLFEKCSFVKKTQNEKHLLAPELVALVRDSIAKKFGKIEKELRFQDIYTLCDQALIHYGSLGEREILTYREGFYRGCSVALIFLTLSFCVAAFEAPNKTLPICAAILSALSVWLSFERYKRFYAYRFRSCLLRFLVLSTSVNGKE